MIIETVHVARSQVRPADRRGVGPLLLNLSQDGDRRARLALLCVQAAFSATGADPFPVRCAPDLAAIIRRCLEV